MSSSHGRAFSAGAEGSLVRRRWTACVVALALAGSLAAVSMPVRASEPPPPPTVRSAREPDRDPRIVFTRAGRAPRIVVANRTGSWLKPLTGRRAASVRPRWHPSGRRILYVRETWSGRHDTDLMLMRPRGHHKTVLLRGEGRPWIQDMAWSPDGRRVALVMDTGRVSGLWVYTRATGELEPLGVHRYPERSVRDVDWSTTGTIAFSAYDLASPGMESDLYLVQPDGSDLRQVTDTPFRFEWGPRYSPDGQQLLYLQEARCGDVVVLANADGSGAERARDVGCDVDSSSWSPHARRLLVVRSSNRDNRSRIWDTTIDGTRQRLIARGEDASWRPSSRTT